MKTKFDEAEQLLDSTFHETNLNLPNAILEESEESEVINLPYLSNKRDGIMNFSVKVIDEEQIKQNQIEQLDYLTRWRPSLEEPQVSRRRGEPSDFDLGLNKRPLSKEEEELISWTTNTYKSTRAKEKIIMSYRGR